MIGHPKFNYDEQVLFKIKIDGEECTKFGTIAIIDRYGTWEDDSDVSYDILVPDDVHKSMRFDSITKERKVEEVRGDCLYKHIREDFIQKLL